MKFLIPVLLLSVSFMSCSEKEYACECNIPDDQICPTPWIAGTVKAKHKLQAESKCNTYEVIREVGSVKCEVK